jgi:methyltransferase (TIGR00027 family)
MESARSDALFRDPFAAELAGADIIGRFTAMPADVRDRFASYTVVRTRIFDDWFTSARGCRQVVLLGAGFDTRAWRLEWLPDTTLWELDQPDVLQAKAQVMDNVQVAAGCRRRTLATDLTVDDWPARLRADGFDPRRPTGWLAEGLLPYLLPEVAYAVLRHVSAHSAAGSQCAMDLVSAEFMTARNSYLTSTPATATTSGGAPFRFGVNDPHALLAQHGWRVDAVIQPGDATANFGRWARPQNMGSGMAFVMAFRA